VTVEERIKGYAAGRPTRRARKKKEWVAPTMDDFMPGAVLAYDQGAFTTGWCYLWVDANGTLCVLDKGVFKEPPVPALKGYADTLQRATWMGERLMAHVNDTARLLPTNPNDYWIVCEMPSVAGWRPELSLMGALALRLATAKSQVRVRMVQNQHMRSVLVGPTEDTSKRVVKEAVGRYTNVTGAGWNEHNRDALALGLTFLYDEKRRRDEQP
jgi:hypothetical protein